MQSSTPEMQGIPKILQFTIVEQRRGLFSPKPQRPQELDFLFRRPAAQRSILKEFLEPRLHLPGTFCLLNKRELLNMPRGHPPVQDNFKIEIC